MTDDVRLPRDQVRRYASRYSYGPEDAVKSLGPAITQRGYMTKAELVRVGEWKSARIRSRIARNSEDAIVETTRLAFATHSVRLAVHIPQALFGVGMPVASTLLHWYHQDPFPILDFRALWSLGIPMPKVYSLEFWESYVAITRALANECDADMRTLDKALWQFSYEHQPQGTQ